MSYKQLCKIHETYPIVTKYYITDSSTLYKKRIIFNGMDNDQNIFVCIKACPLCLSNKDYKLDMATPYNASLSKYHCEECNIQFIIEDFYPNFKMGIYELS